LAEMLKNGVRDLPDVSALASLDANRLCVMVWHYHDDDLPGPDADVQLTCSGLPIATGESRVQQFRIDADHSNSFTAWQKMGSPQQPTAEQYRTLEKAGQLAEFGLPETVHVENGQAVLHLTLPRQAVALLVLQWLATK